MYQDIYNCICQNTHKRRYIIHYVKPIAQLLFKIRFPKGGPTCRRQVVNPRHQTPQGQSFAKQYLAVSYRSFHKNSNRVIWVPPLQWRHMSVKSSDLTGKMFASSTVCSCKQKLKSLFAFSEGNLLVTGGFAKGRQCGNRFHWPLTRYVKLRVVHAPRMPETFSAPSTSKDIAS